MCARHLAGSGLCLERGEGRERLNVGMDEHNKASVVARVRMMVAIRFYYCLHRMNCIAFS